MPFIGMRNSKYLKNQGEDNDGPPAHPALRAMMAYYQIRGIVIGIAKMAGVKPWLRVHVF
jgi:hypothetical protein